MLKVGLIDYLNAFPFTWPIQQNSNTGKLWQYQLARPGELNSKIANGDLDISLVSAFEYLKNQKDYFIAPGIGLSSKGYVNSVKLVSSIPVNELNNKSIHITSASATSVSILKILLGERNIQAKEFITYDCHAGIPPEAIAALTIGDEALTENFNRFPFSWDLGKEWQVDFNKDIVFALCLIRKDSISGNEVALQMLIHAMQQAPIQAFKNSTEFEKACLASYPQIHSPMNYLKNLHFLWQENEINNFNFYLKMCAKHQLTPELIEAEYYEI